MNQGHYKNPLILPILIESDDNEKYGDIVNQEHNEDIVVELTLYAKIDYYYEKLKEDTGDFQFTVFGTVNGSFCTTLSKEELKQLIDLNSEHE